MWIYTHHGGIVCVNGVCEIRLQINGANSEIHVVGGTGRLTLASGAEEDMKAKFQLIKEAIEAPADSRPTHLDFSQ